ncbi:hypothetical protein MHH28_00610 [Paenibacillus sp. FSL K6-1217]
MAAQIRQPAANPAKHATIGDTAVKRHADPAKRATMGDAAVNFASKLFN